MLTILEVVERTAGFFQDKGVPEPRLDAEYLVSHALGLKRLQLYLQFDRPLPEETLEEIRRLVRRRARREPLQHIIGTVDFYGLCLKCDRRALIPRPETEYLVERIKARLGVAPRRILDLGTGSGALALALARLYPEAEVLATDCSEEALALAAENTKALDGTPKVTLLRAMWFEGVEESFSLIVSNPPYLTAAEVAEAEPEVREFEPHEALIAADGGLADLRHILQTAPAHLEPGGLLALETGIHHHPALAEIAEQAGFASWEGEKDLQGRPGYFFATTQPQ